MREASNPIVHFYCFYSNTGEFHLLFIYDPPSATFTLFRIFFSVLFFFFSFPFVFSITYTRFVRRNRFEICEMKFQSKTSDYSFLHRLERKFYIFSRFGRWFHQTILLNIYNIHIAGSWTINQTVSIFNIVISMEFFCLHKKRERKREMNFKKNKLREIFRKYE